MPKSTIPAAAGLPQTALADAELLSLREPLLAAWREEIETVRRHANDDFEKADHATEAATGRTSAIVHRILGLVPTSLAGLGVHALALSWTHSGQPITGRAISGQCTTDVLLLSSIATALINIEGGVDGSFLLSPALHPDGQLLTLGARLKEVDAAKQNHPTADDDAYEALYEEHWSLREKINEIEATTIDGLRVKAFAADAASRNDKGGECTGPGSFIELTRSIIGDLHSERLNARAELDY